MGLYQRNKGKRGEAGARDWLKSLGFADARRTAQHKGTGTSDVECLESLPNLHIEVKFWSVYSTKAIHDAVTQAERDKAKGQRAVVIWRCSTRYKGANTWRLAYLYYNTNGTAMVAKTPPDDELCRQRLKELNHDPERHRPTTG
jgi:hypothetical protein